MGRFKGKYENILVANVTRVEEKEQEAARWVHFVSEVRKGIVIKDHEYGLMSICINTRFNQTLKDIPQTDCTKAGGAWSVCDHKPVKDGERWDP